VGWCLAVTSILKTKLIDEAVFRKGVRIPFQGLGPPWIAIRDDVKDVGVFGDPEDPYSLWTGLQRLCDRIITDNIAGMRRTLEMVEDGKVQSRFRFNSLIEMVYWHLGDTREGGSVQQCAAEDCRRVFIQTDSRQRYCPPDPGEKESPCSRRDRMSRYRNNPTNREKEKRLQRERYHAQKRQGETKREAIVSKHSYCHG